MVRRAKTSLAEDLVDVVALLPWWAGMALAGVSYAMFSAIAASPMPTGGQPHIPGIVLRGIAAAAQYLAPAMFLIGAALSAWRRYERRTLHENVAKSPSADALNTMSWAQFESLVGEAFRQRGFSVVERGGGGPDGGIDLVLTKSGEKYLVQCKQWRAYKVGVEVIRELYGVMAAKGAAGGFVVTSGRFTDEATAFASGRNVTLVDGLALHAMIRGVSPTPTGESAAPAVAPPACPVCAKPMVLRTAKRGPNAGQDFWGCTSYPACRGTRSA
jgi:restriction system protein